MQQDILFFGGLNSDDTLEMFPQGDYLDLENARNFDGNSDNKLGKVSKIKGTVRVANTKRLRSVNVVGVTYAAILSFSQTVGTVKDEPNNKLYYFVYEVYAFNGISDRNYYAIYEYDSDTKRITNCVVRTQLKIFDQDKKVRFGNVVSGKLSWVQDTIQPKMIEIEKAINFTKNSIAQDYEYQPSYQQMTMDEFNLVRKPLVTSIVASYPADGDPTYVTNNIKGKLFQFRAKIVYKDNSESVWGAISRVALPYGQTDANGDDNEDLNLNYINLSFIKPSPEIKEIWLASRYVDSGGILTEFATFKKFDVTTYNTGDTIQYRFYNDVQGTTLSKEETEKVVDLVPLAAGTQEVISNPDRLAYGRVKDPNYPNVDVDVEVSVVTDLIEVISQDPNTNSNVYYDQKTELCAYKFSTTPLLKTRLHLNGRGTCTMIRFNDDWIAEGAEKILIKLTIRVDGVAYTYTTGQLNIAGMTPAQILSEIIQTIQDDYEDNGGIADVAFDDYEDFIIAMNGGYSNTDTSKWTGVGDFNFFGSDPTGSYVVIRTGLLLEFIPTSQSIGTADFPELTCIIQDLINSNYVKRKTSYYVGAAYLTNQQYLYDSSDGELLTSYTFSDENGVYALHRVGTFDGYQTVNLINPSITAEYPQTGISDFGLYLRPTLTPFGKYGVGIVYYDEYLRPSYVQPISEQYILRNDSDYNKPLVYKLQLVINHFAPAWARYWSVVMTKNLSQERITEVDLSIDSGTPITDDADFIYIDVNTSIALWQTRFNNTTGVYDPYVFERGDRVIIYNDTTNKYIDREIVSVDTGGKIMIQKGTLSDTDIADIVRFYKPQVRYIEPLYYETGDIYELNSLKFTIDGVHYKFHTTPESYQTVANPLSLTLEFGDIYLSAINQYALKTNIGVTATPTYNEFFLPFYPSNLNNYGRAFMENKNVYTDFYNSRIRISNALIQDSFTMGLNKFSSSDLMDVPEKHGKIQGLVELGYTLKVITETKLMSIYVNRTVTVDPNGVEGVLLVNKVLGTLSIPEASYGTAYPETIVKTNRNLYFIDVNNGCFVRDAANGQFKISDYKYASYSKRLSEVIKQNDGTIELFSAFNISEFHFFINVKSQKFAGMPDNKGNVLVFNNDLNRWTHHLRLIDSRLKTPEWGDNIGNKLITFIGGELFIHDESTTNNEFYNNNLESEVNFVFNDAVKNVKLLTAIAVHADSLWHSGTNGDIQIPASSNYPLGMSSRLKPVRFRNKEGLWYSEFLKNGLTPSMDYDTGIRQGHKLRGTVATIRLRNSQEEASDLFSVSIKYTPSEYSF